MNYFVLFSVILIAASVVVLLIPPATEGFTSSAPPAMKPNANANAKPNPRNQHHGRPAAAGQHNLSSAAGAADGGSSNQYLMDDLQAQQDRFVDAFENREKYTKANAVSATTTKKKGIASTGASIRGNVNIPTNGCNGKGNGGKGNGGDSGNSCSTCKLNVNKLTKCVLPGCFSADDGYLPFPDDGGYNFAEGCVYYNPDPSNPGKILPGMEGRSPGYYCPSITTGGSFDSSGGDGDPCYTKPNPIPDTANPNAPSYSLDYAKFVKMDKTCSNDKQESKQKVVPRKDAPIDDNDMPPPKNTQHRSIGPTINHQYQHSGSINVYHHSSNQNHGKGQGNQGNSNNTYVDPVGGATVLGYL